MPSLSHYPFSDPPDGTGAPAPFIPAEGEEIALPVDEQVTSQAEEQTAAPFIEGNPAWTHLVERIRARDPEAMEELYHVFCKGIRFYMCRHLGNQELDDRMHDSYLIVVQAIQSGVLRDPERLMGFVRTVVRRQVAAHIEEAVQMRKEHADYEVGSRVPDRTRSPEEEAIEAQRQETLSKVLAETERRDREILTRFYLYDQDQDQICREMGLSQTQFRLLKSRAKSRVGELGRRQISRESLQTLSVRKKAAGSY
jgi:RNA polymerase sigma factor (sigma-70 family)